MQVNYHTLYIGVWGGGGVEGRLSASELSYIIYKLECGGYVPTIIKNLDALRLLLVASELV